jgi:protein-tyrosine-phosphatase/tRNA A37 threonylcarbamoyladenosine synthetase subunit TsaC/SUA5/YrdC
MQPLAFVHPFQDHPHCSALRCRFWRPSLRFPYLKDGGPDGRGVGFFFRRSSKRKTPAAQYDDPCRDRRRFLHYRDPSTGVRTSGGLARSVYQTRLRMAEVLDWQRADPREALALALRLLSEGQLVAFPSEAGYVAAACALTPATVGRLQETISKSDSGRLAVAVSGPGAATDWLPGLTPLGRRLARRCWPGPLILDWSGPVEDGLVSRLPAASRERLLAGETLRLRSPAHEAILEVMRLRPTPLLLAELGNGRPAVTAAEAAEVLGEAGRLLIDDGPSRFDLPPTVVRVAGEHWELEAEGVLSRAALEELLPCRIVFVCTGNTCRSPLAETLCKQLLAERLGCEVSALPERGFCVQSAGLAAMIGAEAAAEAIQTARECGADLSGHQSQPLTRETLTQADYLFVMTRSHLRALASQAAGIGPPPRLLGEEDIPDPIGGPPEIYRDCARRIRIALERLLPELK